MGFYSSRVNPAIVSRQEQRAFIPIYLESDGTQVYPVAHLTMPDALSYLQVTGEIRWSPTDGLTFKFEILHDADISAVPPLHGGSPRLPPGQFSDVPDQPAWTGTIGGGGEFRLYLPKGKSSTIQRLGPTSHTSTTVFQGKAFFAEIRIPRSSPLSFWHESPQCPRYFIAGLNL